MNTITIDYGWILLAVAIFVLVITGTVSGWVALLVLLSRLELVVTYKQGAARDD